MQKLVLAVLAVFASLMGRASVAFAQIDLPESVDVSDVQSLVGTVLVGLFAIWAIRKVIKLVNRS